MGPEADSAALGCTQQYYQTTKYQLSRSLYRRELTWNFLQKKGGQILPPETQNWAHFVRRYLKHAVSSEAVTVAVVSIQ